MRDFTVTITNLESGEISNFELKAEDIPHAIGKALNRAPLRRYLVETLGDSIQMTAVEVG